MKLSSRAYFEFFHVLYSLIVAFILLFNNTLGLICTIYVNNNFSTEVSCYDNMILIFCYFIFDILFHFVECPPPDAYKFGILLYTFGYGCFMIPNLLSLMGKSETYLFEL